MKTLSHISNIATKLIICGLVFAASVAFTTTATAQTKSTLDGFKKPKVKKQIAPKRQLALRIETQEKKNQDDKAKPNTLQSQPAAKNQAAPKTDKKPAPNVSTERRKELMSFLEEHHKELRPLLYQLKKNRPVQYQTVLRSLDNKVRSMRNIEKKSPERYKRVLKDWTIQSKIQLLSAQIAIKKTPKEKDRLRNLIKPLLEEQLDLRIKQVQTDADQAKAKSERLTAQLNGLKAKRDDGEVARRMKEIEKASQRISAQRKKNDKKKKENVAKKKTSESSDKEKTKNQE